MEQQMPDFTISSDQYSLAFLGREFRAPDHRAPQDDACQNREVGTTSNTPSSHEIGLWGFACLRELLVFSIMFGSCGVEP
jgi:hypothetical protein